MDATSSPKYASLLRQCGRNPAAIDRVRSLMASTGQDRETLAGNLLVQAYGRAKLVERALDAFDACDRHDEAMVVFRSMDLEGIVGDEITLLNAVSACAAMEDLFQGKQLHDRIFSSGFGNSVLLNNSLICLYGKCGSVEDAKNVFDGIVERDLVSWNAMIDVYTQHQSVRTATAAALTIP